MRLAADMRGGTFQQTTASRTNGNAEKNVNTGHVLHTRDGGRRRAPWPLARLSQVKSAMRARRAGFLTSPNVSATIPAGATTAAAIGGMRHFAAARRVAGATPRTPAPYPTCFFPARAIRVRARYRCVAGTQEEIFGPLMLHRLRVRVPAREGFARRRASTSEKRSQRKAKRFLRR
ncbi:hypothetical protein VTO73DRAFT_5600 [Trametes versicolor]